MMADRVAPYGISALVTGQSQAAPDAAKIKRNIQRMIEQNAPEDDIDAYVASEGVTPEFLRGETSGGERSPVAPWNMTSEAMDMLTMGGQSKLNAAGVGLIDATVDAIQGEGGGFWENYNRVYNRELNEQRQAQAQYGEDSPVLKRVGQGVGLGVGVARLPAVTMLKGAGLAPKLVNAAATGAAYGGASGAIADADSLEERAKNVGIGSVIGGGLGPAAVPLAKGIGKVIDKVKGNKSTVPTVDQLRADKNAKYDSAETGIGKVQMPQTDFLWLSRNMNKVADDNNAAGVLTELTDALYSNSKKALSGVNRVAQEIASGKRPPPTYGELEKMRQTLRQAANASVQPDGRMSPDGRMASEFIDQIDDLIGQTPYKAAREAHKTLRKAEIIEDALYRAELANGANYTQAGMESALRHQFKSLAIGKNFERTFNAEEQKAILAVVNGTKPQNFFRRFGALAPKGGVSTMFNLMMGIHAPSIGIPLGIAATGARMGATAKTIGNARAVDEMVRNGGVPPALPPPSPLGELLQNPLAQLADVSPANTVPGSEGDEGANQSPASNGNVGSVKKIKKRSPNPIPGCHADGEQHQRQYPPPVDKPWPIIHFFAFHGTSLCN